MIKKENNFVFIDNQNLYAELKRCQWELDYERFIVYLREKYSARRIFLFIGYIEEMLPFYEKLYEFGYEFVFKPTIKTPIGVKGNCDSDLVLHVMRQIQIFDKAIIVSGDGDFTSLIEYLLFRDKLRILLVPNHLCYSGLLKRFREHTHYMNNLQYKLSKRKPP